MTPRSAVGAAAECAYCGKGYLFVRDGIVPFHDLQTPCRLLCPGSKQPPRRPGEPLGKEMADEQT